MNLKPVLSLPVLATLVVLGALVALDLCALGAARHFDEAVGRYAAESRTRALLAELPATVLDMEAGMRGYLLTGERAELSRYRTASARLPGAINAAIERTGDDELRARLKELRELSERWLGTRLSPLVVKRDAGQGSTESMREIVQNLRGAHGDPLAVRIREGLSAAVALQDLRLADARIGIEAASDEVAGWMRVRVVALVILVAALALLLGRVLLRLTGQISSRENAERSARESSAALQGMNDAAPLGMFTTDAGGTLREANAAFARMTGLADAALIDPGWLSVLHPDDRERVHAAWKQAIADAKPFASEHRFLHRNGDVVWVALKTGRIMDGDRLIGHAGMAENVTERRNAEEALRRSEERLQLALEAAGLVAFDWHLPSGQIMLGRQWHALVGGEMEDGTTTARRFAEWLHPEDREALREALIGSFKGRTRGFQSQFRVRAPNGQWKRLRAYGRVTERDALGRAVQLTGTFSAASQPS